MTDDADTIALKIRRAKTDPEPLPATIAELERRPEADNLIGIYGALAGLAREEALARFAGRNFSEFKDSIRPAPLGLRLLIGMLGPIALALGYRREVEKYLRAS